MNTESTYRLLGVDPGTNILGYAIIELRKKEIFLVNMGIVKMNHLEGHQHKLKKIFDRIQDIIKKYNPQTMAIEAPFYGKNVQSMLKLGRAQGVAIAAAMTSGLEISEYSPKKIKQSITGNGNASKEQVAAMLRTILNNKFEDTYLDATDALATAVCHHFQMGNKFSGRKRYNNWQSFLKDNPSRLKKKS